MANRTITQIPTTATTAQSAVFEIEQGGVSKQISSSVIESTLITRAEWTAHTYAGYGSSGTKIPYFTTVTANVDTAGAMTVSNSATNGLSITINIAGRYAVNFFFDPSSGEYAGISVNASATTTNIQSLAAAERRDMAYGGGSSETISVGLTMYLSVNDVVRPHTNGVSAGAASRCGFSIVKVS